MEKYKTIKVIGDGAYGVVTKAVNVITGEVVAIKKMKKKAYRWEHCIELKEIKSLIKLTHPNIVRLLEVIKEKNTLHFVFEFLDVNVYQMMSDRQKPLPEISIRNIVYQTLQGLAYMHKNGFFHRDMKPENLLCFLDYVKIADFGLAKEITAQPPFTDYVATRWYRAPEIILRYSLIDIKNRSTTYNAPIDIFAVGAILAELYTMRPLFPGSSEIDQMNKICQVLGSPTKDSWPEGFRLAEQTGFKFPAQPPASLRSIIQTASESAFDLITRTGLWEGRDAAVCPD
eukprot:TRINITY_DN2099_c0_g2_i2.p1 TRINITY_DN2099_c0_g2~~TRINITY_DN2099_c0_g2_i2.p1  ORF type:complete len:286 (+),score=86.48 TRINITY_DN2099_c0_g2_i2:191-1048(+)